VLGRERGKEEEKKMEKGNGRGAAEVWIAFRGTKSRGAEEEDEQLVRHGREPESQKGTRLVP
jgi:hypothetical protein